MLHPERCLIQLPIAVTQPLAFHVSESDRLSVDRSGRVVIACEADCHGYNADDETDSDISQQHQMSSVQ